MAKATLSAWHACMMCLVALCFSCCPGMAQIVLYQHYNFKGKSKSLSSSSTSLSGFHDQASSIKVKSGTWRVYQHSNFKGTSKVYAPGDYPKISPNDQASSVKLIAAPASDEGKVCRYDSECQGYCEIAQCWDGSHGDRCGSTSDCQGTLNCERKKKCWKGWLGNTHCVPVDAFNTCR